MWCVNFPAKRVIVRNGYEREFLVWHAKYYPWLNFKSVGIGDGGEVKKNGWINTQTLSWKRAMIGGLLH